MNKTSPALGSAIAEHEVQTRQLKDSYASCIKRLAVEPTDKALHAEIADLSARLAATGTALAALRQAHDDAVETEREASAAEAKAAAQRRVSSFLHAAKARRASYEQLQVAADAFISTLEKHLEQGRVHGQTAGTIAAGLYGDRVGDHAGPLSEAASGLTRGDAAALGTVLRRAIEAFGTHRLAHIVAINDFIKPVSFAEAHAANRTAVDRVEHA